MSNVRRCDNPACPNGPAKKTPATSADANPAGWVVLTAQTLGGATVAGDYDTAECAAQALLADHPFDVVPATAS